MRGPVLKGFLVTKAANSENVQHAMSPRAAVADALALAPKRSPFGAPNFTSVAPTPHRIPFLERPGSRDVSQARAKDEIKCNRAEFWGKHAEDMGTI